jgi:DNA-binding response OmpR family regulator
MRILYVEDDTEKANKIIKFLNSNVEKCDVKLCNSYMSGVLSLEDNRYDLVILDMSLPLYDSNVDDDINEFLKFAGLDFMDEMKRTDIKTNVIVITAFEKISDNVKELTLEQLKEQMENEYNGIYLGSVYYSTKSLEWCQNLLDLIK